MKIETKEDYTNFISYLETNKPCISEEDADRHIRIICTSYPCLHYKMQDIRRLAREIYKDGYSGLIKHSNNHYYEEVLIKGLVVAHIKDKGKMYSELEDYLPLIDSWSICDSVITSFDALKKGADESDYNKFYKWATSEKEFTSRFGLMMIFKYFMQKDKIAEIFKLICSLKTNAYYVKMGAAWLVAELMAKFPIETEKYIKEKKLDDFIQNKAISKCNDSYRIDKETKLRLKSYRIIRR